MHGPTDIFWANLTPFSLQRDAAVAGTVGQAAAGAATKEKVGQAWGTVLAVTKARSKFMKFTERFQAGLRRSGGQGGPGRTRRR